MGYHFYVIFAIFVTSTHNLGYLMQSTPPHAIANALPGKEKGYQDVINAKKETPCPL